MSSREGIGPPRCLGRSWLSPGFISASDFTFSYPKAGSSSSKDAGCSPPEGDCICCSLPSSGISGKGSDWPSWGQVPNSNQSVVVMWVGSVRSWHLVVYSGEKAHIPGEGWILPSADQEQCPPQPCSRNLSAYLGRELDATWGVPWQPRAQGPLLMGSMSASLSQVATQKVSSRIWLPNWIVKRDEELVLQEEPGEVGVLACRKIWCVWDGRDGGYWRPFYPGQAPIPSPEYSGHEHLQACRANPLLCRGKTRWNSNKSVA